ncbi:RNA-directed DNA polymerase, eukaryota [Tanacetum coccineum]
MGSFRSKEDDVAKISTSIFVSNFPDSVSAKDLFHSCKQYGHVVDSFIPMKRLKDGKRFGFVRFINVFNVERLVNNLCTIWLNRCKLHANIARFNRDQKNGNKYKTANQKKHEGRKNTFYDPSKEAGTFDSRNSFVNVLKGTNMVKETDSSPVIVLEEDCLNSKDLSNSLIGRVKDVGSLSNLKKVLCNEGFDNIFVRYMGELWVLLEFDNTKAKELFRDNVGVGSWFSVLRQASHDFTPEGRIAWVDVEGIPFKFWSGKTFKKIATKWGELLDVDDHDEMSFHSKRICIHTKICSNICENFKIVFKGKVHWIRAKEATGWIPEFSEDEEDDDHSEQEFISSEQSDLGLHIDGEDNGASEVPETIFENSDGMKERQSEDPFGLYSILNKNKVKSDVIREVNDENPSLKYPPGFTPSVEKNGSKSKDDQVQNISDNQLNGDNESVHQVEREDNRNSDGAKTNSTGSRKFKMSEIPRTGGSILSVMEEIVKVGITMGYNMDGCANDITKIIESQGGYGAPHDVRDKRLLWDYLSHVSNQWAGEVVMMGDFNEVRYKSDRFGSNFNAHGADIFNNFILTPRFLLDHRPILLREASFDYGPTPFWFFHFWFDVDGFDKFVTDSWKDAPGDDSNEELRILDELIDKGNGLDEIVNNRLEILGKLQKANKAQASEPIIYSGYNDNGTWTDNPEGCVIGILLQHFETGLIKASGSDMLILRCPFPNSLSGSDQQKDLVCMVSKDRGQKGRPFWSLRGVLITDVRRGFRLPWTSIVLRSEEVTEFKLARKISSWWNVDYVDVSSYEEWYTWLVSLRLQANLKAVFEGIFYCLWWSVWMFRNKILFEKDTPSQARIFDNIVSNSYYWLRIKRTINDRVCFGKSGIHGWGRFARRNIMEGEMIDVGADKKRCHNRLNKGRMDLEYLKQVQEELLSNRAQACVFVGAGRGSFLGMVVYSFCVCKPTVTIKAKIDVVKEIREALTPTQVEIFEKTCFGHWLDVGLKKNSQLLIHTLLTCMVDGKANELSFLVLGKRIHFRRQEFCLVTGLRFGCNMYMKKWVENLTDNPFRNRMFPHIEAKVSVKLSDVIDIFDKMRKRSLVLEDNDAVRICLLVLLQQGFLGHQLSHNVSDDMLKLVEHLSNCWNIFPCGSYIWEYTYSQLRDALHKRKLRHDAKREKGKKIQYTMTGFVWAFMIWILDTIPATHRHLAPPLETLTPTKPESETDWWKASLEYFEGKHVQSEVVSEQLEIEKDGISEKKRKRGSSQPSFQDPTYDQLMTRVSTLEGTVTTLTQTVSSLHGTIGTLESRLLALEGDARGNKRDFGVVSNGDIPAYMSPGPSYTSHGPLRMSPTLTAHKSLPLVNLRKLRVRRTPLKLKSPMRCYYRKERVNDAAKKAIKDAVKDAAKDTHLDAVTTMSVPMTTTEVKIDDLNITMEEYIRLEEEKACRRGKMYNWETATYGKILYDEDVHDLRSA